MAKSELEEELLFQMRAVGLPEPEREFRFMPPRRYRFDFSWRHENLVHGKLAVEVEGGGWNYGRHHRPGGFEDDCVKYAEAALRGWVVLRVTGAMVKDGRALAYIERALSNKMVGV